MDKREEQARRLKAARERAKYENATVAAEAFGWGVSGYRHHENGTRGFGPDAAKKYGKAFKVKPGWLLVMDGFDDAPVSATPGKSSELDVNGSVEAGVWRETTEWGDDRRFTIVDMPSPVKDANRFGLTVRGLSMDRVYEPGTVLDCVSIFKNGVEPENGDHVIVEHIRPDGLRELTVKEFLVEDGDYFLVPRSTRAEFHDRIKIGKPDRGHFGDDEIRVIAFVVASYPPRVLRLFERLGKIRR